MRGVQFVFAACTNTLCLTPPCSEIKEVEITYFVTYIPHVHDCNAASQLVEECREISSFLLARECNRQFNTSIIVHSVSYDLHREFPNVHL